MKVRPLVQEISSSQTTSLRDNTQSSEQQQIIKNRQYNILPIRGRKQKCIVCKKPCNYCCPKCNKNYCGIQHYKSHNLFCSQQFYEKQVNQMLKGLKIKDKKQKKKAIEMVNKYQQQIEQQIFYGQLNMERLEQILKIIESGKQPNLTKKQQYLFQQYLKSLTQNIFQQQNKTKSLNPENTQNTLPQIQTPYWQIQDGLSAYINKNSQIQQYQQADYPQTVAHRHIYSKQLQQFIQFHPSPSTSQSTSNYPQKQINQIIHYHLLQIVYTFISLYRMYDGECQQFKQLFICAYCCKQNQTILKMDGIQLIDFINGIERDMMKMDYVINGKNQNQGQKQKNNVMKIWIQKYGQFIVDDISKIFKNKYLVIQTLLRIIQLVKVKNQTNLNNSVVQSINQSTINSQNSHTLTKAQKMAKKIIKKCQYLLYIVVYHYNQNKKNYEQIIRNLYKIKQEICNQANITKKQKLFAIINTNK